MTEFILNTLNGNRKKYYLEKKSDWPTPNDKIQYDIFPENTLIIKICTFDIGSNVTLLKKDL